MNLKKIIKYIKSILHKKKSRKSKIFLNEVKQTSFIKTRKFYTIKNINFDNFKFLGNNKNTYYILIIFIILGIILFTTFGPIFRIKNIEITKQDNITNMIIAYNATNIYRGKYIFTPEKKNILKRLKNYQQNIKNIKTNIVLPNTLKITINSYLGVFNTIINKKTYILTENGVLIPSPASEELKTINIQNYSTKNKFLDYKDIFDKSFITKITNIVNSLEENIISIKIKKITYYVTEREVHIQTEKNTTIIFDLNVKENNQIEKIAIFNKDYKDISKESIIYIDLRIKNKIFYCTTENEYKCLNNIKSIYSKE